MPSHVFIAPDTDVGPAEVAREVLEWQGVAGPVSVIQPPAFYKDWGEMLEMYGFESTQKILHENYPAAY